jgi:hypothetical protein
VLLELVISAFQRLGRGRDKVERLFELKNGSSQRVVRLFHWHWGWENRGRFIRQMTLTQHLIIGILIKWDMELVRMGDLDRDWKDRWDGLSISLIWGYLLVFSTA